MQCALAGAAEGSAAAAAGTDALAAMMQLEAARARAATANAAALAAEKVKDAAEEEVARLQHVYSAAFREPCGERNMHTSVQPNGTPRNTMRCCFSKRKANYVEGAGETRFVLDSEKDSSMRDECVPLRVCFAIEREACMCICYVSTQ